MSLARANWEAITVWRRRTELVYYENVDKSKVETGEQDLKRWLQPAGRWSIVRAYLPEVREG